MTSFVIYTIVLLVLAFLLGAAVGCMFRRWWAPGEVAVDEYLVADREMSAEPARAANPVEAPAAAAIRPKPAPKSAPEPPADTAGAQRVAADKPKAAASAGRQKIAAASAGSKSARARKPAAAKPSTRTAAKTGTAAKTKTTAKTKTAAKTRTAAKVTKPDDLKKLKGVGQKIEGQLREAGITSFAQVAKWTKKDIESFDDVLKFHGRIQRDDWVGQAKLLAAGKETEFSKRVKGGDVPTSVSKAPSKRGRARKET